MPHIWIRDTSREWLIRPLTGSELSLDELPPRPLPPEPHPDGSPPASTGSTAAPTGSPTAAAVSPCLVPAGNDAGDWAVVVGAGHDVRVNGFSLPAGLRVLEDRDEVRLADLGSFYFSTEELAQVTTFPGSETPHACPRCKIVLEKGDEALKCPGCGVWSHEGVTVKTGEERRCWTYSETCALCHQTTAADEGYQWSPEDL